MTFMYILYILPAAVLLLAVYMYLESGWLQVRRIDFSRGRKGLKILQISDVHVDLLNVSAGAVRKVVKAENPDIIIFSGDYINKPIHASIFLEFLHTVSKGYRTFLCLGNHDLRAYGRNKKGLETFIREIEALKVEVLQNRTAVINKNSSYYNIVGIDDLRLGRPDVEKALEGCMHDAPKIAFTHNPDLVLEIPGKIVDYLLCGHFHGGQIWMPFNMEFFLIRDDKLCRMGIKRGLHKVNDIKLYINRGIGNAAIPLRFLSRPEITVYNI